MDVHAQRERLIEIQRSIRTDIASSMLPFTLPDDLRLVHGVTLQVLQAYDDPTVKELAAYVGRSVSQTSRIVEHLVRKGLAERHEDPDDRRVRRVRIAPEGTALLRKVDEVRAEGQLRLWEHLTPDEQEAALHGLELMAKAARRIRDEADRAG